MPALTLQFSDEELASLLQAADPEGRSPESLARELVVEAVSSPKHLVEGSAFRVARISADSNRRSNGE